MSYDTNKLTARKITLLAVVLSIRIVLSYVPAFKYGDFFEMGVGFIGAAFSGALFGPWYACLVGVLNDLITSLLHGKNFFIGFTISAGLGGVFYGVGLWRKKKTLTRIFTTVLMVTLIINVLLNTLWVKILVDKAWMVLFIPRLIKNIISLFVNTGVLYVIFKHPTVERLIDKYEF